MRDKLVCSVPYISDVLIRSGLPLMLHNIGFPSSDLIGGEGFGMIAEDIK